MEFRMKIADVLMDVSSQYEMLAEYCREYIVEDSAEEVSERLVLTMEDIEKERAIAEKSGESVPTLGLQQNMPQYSPQYLETLAALRKIADFMPEKDCFLMHGAVIAWKNQGYLFTAEQGSPHILHCGRNILEIRRKLSMGTSRFLKLRKTRSGYMELRGLEKNSGKLIKRLL